MKGHPFDHAITRPGKTETGMPFVYEPGDETVDPQLRLQGTNIFIQCTCGHFGVAEYGYENGELTWVEYHAETTSLAKAKAFALTIKRAN